MSNNDYVIKLHSSLKFDPIKEKDIIEKVEMMADSRELTYYITNLLKYALDNPESVSGAGISKAGYQISKAREDYFKQLAKEISEMKDKIDRIYIMADKINSLVLLGKTVGIEDRNKNILQTQFLLQRQIKELSDVLGISMMGKTFEANRMVKYEEKAEEFIEYVIEHYDGIVKEIVKSRKESRLEIDNKDLREYRESPQKDILEHQSDTFKLDEKIKIDKSSDKNSIKNTEMSSDEDFGDDEMDMDALGDFFSA